MTRPKKKKKNPDRDEPQSLMRMVCETVDLKYLEKIQAAVVIALLNLHGAVLPLYRHPTRLGALPEVKSCPIPCLSPVPD